MILKSRITFLLAFFTSIFTLQSQPNWFPENAEWYYTVHCLSDPLCGHLYYYTAGDTVINGESAIVVGSQYENNESQQFQNKTHYFRVENDTVFFFSDSTNAWEMVYDFNAQPGDVWDLTETLPFDISEVYGEGAVARVEVDSLTTEMLAGMMRRVVYTSPWQHEEEIEQESVLQFVGPIVEGIGPVGGSWGLLGEPVVFPLGGFLPHFSCYRENGSLIYGSGELPCGIVSGVDEETAFEFAVFPNPTTSHIRLQLPPEFAFQAEIRIYNSVGQSVAQIENFNTLNPLPMNYPPGLYVVEARNGNKVARSKVVVE